MKNRIFIKSKKISPVRNNIIWWILPLFFFFFFLGHTQAGIKIAGRNINNLRYADDTTLMAESEEELKSLLMKVKVKKLA